MEDEAADEFHAYFNSANAPKVLITTSVGIDKRGPGLLDYNSYDYFKQLITNFCIRKGDEAVCERSGDAHPTRRVS